MAPRKKLIITESDTENMPPPKRSRPAVVGTDSDDHSDASVIVIDNESGSLLPLAPIQPSASPRGTSRKNRDNFMTDESAATKSKPAAKKPRQPRKPRQTKVAASATSSSKKGKKRAGNASDEAEQSEEEGPQEDTGPAENRAFKGLTAEQIKDIGLAIIKSKDLRAKIHLEEERVAEIRAQTAREVAILEKEKAVIDAEAKLKLEELESIQKQKIMDHELQMKRLEAEAELASKKQQREFEMQQKEEMRFEKEMERDLMKLRIREKELELQTKEMEFKLKGYDK